MYAEIAERENENCDYFKKLETPLYIDYWDFPA